RFVIEREEEVIIDGVIVAICPLEDSYIECECGGSEPLMMAMKNCDTDEIIAVEPPLELEIGETAILDGREGCWERVAGEEESIEYGPFEDCECGCTCEQTWLTLDGTVTITDDADGDFDVTDAPMPRQGDSP